MLFSVDPDNGPETLVLVFADERSLSRTKELFWAKRHHGSPVLVRLSGHVLDLSGPKRRFLVTGGGTYEITIQFASGKQSSVFAMSEPLRRPPSSIRTTGAEVRGSFQDAQGA